MTSRRFDQGIGDLVIVAAATIAGLALIALGRALQTAVRVVDDNLATLD